MEPITSCPACGIPLHNLWPFDDGTCEACWLDSTPNQPLSDLDDALHRFASILYHGNKNHYPLWFRKPTTTTGSFP